MGSRVGSTRTTRTMRAVRLAGAIVALGSLGWSSEVVAAAGAERWIAIGPPGAYFVALAPAPKLPGTVYGSDGGAVFRSEDGARSWSLAGNLGAPLRRLVADPVRSTTVYAATDVGLFKTTDGGATWKLLAAAGTSVSLVAVAPSARAVLYAEDVNGGIERSGDGGATWQPMGRLPATCILFVDLAIHPTNPDLVYVFNGASVCRTANGGAHWSTTPLHVGDLPLRMVLDPRHPSVLYAAFKSSPLLPASDPKVLRSTDGGATWSRADGGLGQPLFDLVLAPSGALYAAVQEHEGTNVPGTRFFQSVDGGASWQPTAALPVSVAMLAADPGVPDRLYGTADPGSVLVSDDEARSWQAPATAPSALVVWNVVARPGVAGALCVSCVTAGGEMGLSDFRCSADGGATWNTLGTPIPVPANSRLLFGASPEVYYAASFAEADVTDDGGASWEMLDGFFKLADQFPDFAVDPHRAGRLVAIGTTEFCGPPNVSCISLFLSNNGGRTWRQVAQLDVPPSVDLHFAQVRLEPTGSGIMYVLAANDLYKRSPGTANLSLLPLRGPVVDLAVDPLTPTTLYAAVGRRHQLYKSRDGGVTWFSASAGLPAGAKARLLAIDPRAPATLYLATDQAVFVSDDGAASWQSLSNGLPGFAIDSLAVASAGPRTLYAATAGAGVYALTRDR